MYNNLEIGMKVTSSLGKVMILDVKEKYLVLFRLDHSSFVVANGYEYKNGKLSWSNGDYYNSLDEVMKNIG